MCSCSADLLIQLIRNCTHIQVGGPIALLQDGDVIVIDAESKTITVEISQEEMTARANRWVAPPLKATKGTLFKYIKSVSSASKGCVTDE